MDAPHVLVAVDDRDLGDDGLNPRVDGGEDQDMAARVGDAPGADALRIDLVVALEETHGVLVVADLRPWVEVLAVVAVADAEIAVVEDERIEPGLGEGLGIGRHDDLAHIAPAAGQHDRRPPLAGASPHTANRGRSCLRT